MAEKKAKATAAKTKGSVKVRKETDLLGTLELPADALYGVQAARGFDNFKITNIPMSHYPNFIKGFAYTKWGAAIANNAINPQRVTKKHLDAIVKACKEIIAGQHHDAFASDMIQGGAGTTMNMNANEVIANRALQIMGHKPGEYQYCNPNDHVNCSQSTNDAYPTAMHLGLYFSHVELIEALKPLIKSLEKKGKDFAKMVKMGRTQLQDAVPMTLGQTFNGFADGLKREVEALNAAAEAFLTVNMGATAIGTGINAEPGYAEACTKALAAVTKLKIKLDKNLIFVTSDNGGVVNYSSGLKRLAVRLGKICNDLRLMGSGPRCGLQEVFLPEMQPGSSIMPGKVNPVIPEVVNQVCFRVIGNDLTVTMAADAAQLELNVMEPVMCYAVFESIELLKNAFSTLKTLCIDGLKANEKRCREMVENSIGIITMLNPYIGHHEGDVIAKEAKATGKSVIDLVLKKKLMSKADLDKIMRTENMVNPVKLDIKPAKK